MQRNNNSHLFLLTPEYLYIWHKCNEMAAGSAAILAAPPDIGDARSRVIAQILPLLVCYLTQLYTTTHYHRSI